MKSGVREVLHAPPRVTSAAQRIASWVSARWGYGSVYPLGLVIRANLRSDYVIISAGGRPRMSLSAFRAGRGPRRLHTQHGSHRTRQLANLPPTPPHANILAASDRNPLDSGSTMTSATQGPIPIARGGDGIQNGNNESPAPTRFGASAGAGSYLGMSGSLGGSSSFKESMALSFGKDVAEYVLRHHTCAY